MAIMTDAKCYFNQLMVTLIEFLTPGPLSHPTRDQVPAERLKKPGLIGLMYFINEQEALLSIYLVIS